MQKAEKEQVILADLDFTNPYFVSRDLEYLLKIKNVRLVAPDSAMSMADIPNLPPEIISLFRQNPEMIVDMPGDTFGALVLGYLAKYIKKEECRIYLVVNPYRPFSAAEDICADRDILEKAGQIQVSGIISNPHMVEDTTASLVIDGHGKVMDLAEELDLPVKYLLVTEKHYQEVYRYYGKMVKQIKIYLRPDWLLG